MKSSKTTARTTTKAKTKTKTKIKMKAEETSCFCPKSPTSLLGDIGEFEEIENEGKQSLEWLTSAFHCISIEQIDSAYKEARGDVYVAAGILGAELVDPGENLRSSGKKRCARKQKRVAASTGTISGVIGKDYSKSASACNGRRRGWGDSMGERAGCSYNSKEAEDFLCSMFAGVSEMNIGVIRDVLSHCGYNLGKALDKLLDISKLSRNQFKEIIGVDHIEMVSSNHRKGDMRKSEIHSEVLSKDTSRNSRCSFQFTDKPSVSTYHPFAKEHDNLQYVGSGCRKNFKSPLNIKDQIPLHSGVLNPDLQQVVLESLFNIPKSPYVGNNLNWKKVVEQVESSGHELKFSFEGSAEPLSESGSGREVGYHVSRSVAQKNWNTMRSYYHKATQAYSNGERAHASYLSEKGKFYKKLAHEADEKASQEIFQSRNSEIRNTVTIDLHGQHVKQAIQLVKLHLLLFAYIPSIQFLRVITGCGADGLGLGRLKRAVLDLVEKECIKCTEENSGTLLLSIGTQRSFSFMESEIDSDGT